MVVATFERYCINRTDRSVFSRCKKPMHVPHFPRFPRLLHVKAQHRRNHKLSKRTTLSAVQWVFSEEGGSRLIGRGCRQLPLWSSMIRCLALSIVAPLNFSFWNTKGRLRRCRDGMATFQYDDDDPYGVPKLLIPTRTRAQKLRISYLRWKRPLLITIAIIFLLYWFRRGECDPTDWSRFAYVQYATDTHTLCNSVMIFESLKRLGSKANRVLLYPEEWHVDWKDPDRSVQLLIRAKRDYGVKLKSIQLLGLDEPAEPGSLKSPTEGYSTSITKLRIFELDEYDRVLYFDSDSVLQQHMDELFTMPKTAAAMPRAYWSEKPRDQWPLSTALMLVQPNAGETKHLWETLRFWRLSPDRDDSRHWDNDLLLDRFGSSALVLPHRPYFMQSGEFRKLDHAAYLGSYGAPASLAHWDPNTAIKEAKLIHFSDWPLPKPWIMWPRDGLKEMQPSCGGSRIATCPEREIWKGLYDDFRQRRRDVCKLLSVSKSAQYRFATYANQSI